MLFYHCLNLESQHQKSATHSWADPDGHINQRFAVPVKCKSSVCILGAVIENVNAQIQSAWRLQNFPQNPLAWGG